VRTWRSLIRSSGVHRRSARISPSLRHRRARRSMKHWPPPCRLASRQLGGWHLTAGGVQASGGGQAPGAPAERREAAAALAVPTSTACSPGLTDVIAAWPGTALPFTHWATSSSPELGGYTPAQVLARRAASGVFTRPAGADACRVVAGSWSARPARWSEAVYGPPSSPARAEPPRGLCAHLRDDGQPSRWSSWGS
jgi:hypothetical protein